MRRELSLLQGVLLEGGWGTDKSAYAEHLCTACGQRLLYTSGQSLSGGQVLFDLATYRYR